MTPKVKEGEIRFVLDWPNGPIGLDLYSYFKISKLLKCTVFFGKRECPGVNLEGDSSENDSSGEVITINQLGNYTYTFAVNKYIDVSNNTAVGDNPVEGYIIPKHINQFNYTVPDTRLSQSEAKISIYSFDYIGPVAQISVNSKQNDSDKLNWWLSFCLDGSKGINSLSVVNKLFSERPQFNYCENYFMNLS
jgi:hypothetical protein